MLLEDIDQVEEVLGHVDIVIDHVGDLLLYQLVQLGGVLGVVITAEHQG